MKICHSHQEEERLCEQKKPAGNVVVIYHKIWGLCFSLSKSDIINAFLACRETTQNKTGNGNNRKIATIEKWWLLPENLKKTQVLIYSNRKYVRQEPPLSSHLFRELYLLTYNDIKYRIFIINFLEHATKCNNKMYLKYIWTKMKNNFLCPFVDENICSWQCFPSYLAGF